MGELCPNGCGYTVELWGRVAYVPTQADCPVCGFHAEIRDMNWIVTPIVKAIKQKIVKHRVMENA